MLREIRRFKPFSPAERNGEESHGVLGCQRVDLLVVGENLKEADSYALLRQGMKGILNYAEGREQLPRALALVASGGYWVPRKVLSRFVDFILNTTQGRRMRGDSASELSRREEEVLSALLEDLANKEVADRLHISERTVKFHVSNLFTKFGVRRRAELILRCYQRHATVWTRS